MAPLAGHGNLAALSWRRAANTSLSAADLKLSAPGATVRPSLASTPGRALAVHEQSVLRHQCGPVPFGDAGLRLVRFGNVWEDVRTVLLLVVVMFLATSVTFDDLFVAQPGWRFW